MACPGSLQKTVPPPWEQPRAGAAPRGAAQMQQPPTSRGPQWEPDMARGPSSGAYVEALRLSQNGYNFGGFALLSLRTPTALTGHTAQLGHHTIRHRTRGSGRRLKREFRSTLYCQAVTVSGYRRALVA